jgi:hypothetical protein
MTTQDNRVVRVLRVRWYMASTIVAGAIVFVAFLAAGEWAWAGVAGVAIVGGILSIWGSYKRME